MTEQLVAESDAWLDRFFAESYRSRRHYVEYWLNVTGLGIVFLAWPAQHLTQMPLLGGAFFSLDEFAVFMAAGIVVTVVSRPLLARTSFRPLIRHARGESVDPVEVWTAAVRTVPATGVIMTVLYAVIGNTVGVVYAGHRRHFSVGFGVGAWLAETLITITALAFFILIWEVALRPILRDLEPLLPADFEPEHGWMTLSRRTILAIVSVMTYTGSATAGIVSGFGNREVRLLVEPVAAVAAAGTFGGLVTVLVLHSITMRLSVLNRAMRSIGDGDFSTRVAVRDGDEFDTAGRALNQMVSRLEGHRSELRASRARLAVASDDARRRMERDLRLGVETRVHELDLVLAQLAGMLEEDPALLVVCEDIRGELATASAEIRGLGQGIYPALLESGGLGAALTDLAARAAIPARVDTTVHQRFRRDVESAIYFCCSEALQNASKHAGPAATATVEIGLVDGLLEFAVSDNGRGFASVGAGRGLANMGDRLRALGGDVVIRSVVGRGTEVRGWIAPDLRPGVAGPLDRAVGTA